MRSVQAIAATIALTATATGGSMPAAQAVTDYMALNGTYRVASLGDLAKTNMQLHPEATVRSTWTITSTCSTVQDCTGTVTSDQGWSEPLSMRDGVMWNVRHDVPNWESCPDGSSFTGKQMFMFYPVNSEGGVQIGSPVLAGRDKTTGPSGACGANRWLVIEMPMRMDKIT